MAGKRIDEVARTVGGRRGLIAAIGATIGLLWSRRTAGAQAYCSASAAACLPWFGCCTGLTCTFEYNAWVGRCGTLNPDGTITVEELQTTEEAQETGRHGRVGGDGQKLGHRAKVAIRREDRRAYRQRRSRGRLRPGGGNNRRNR